MVPLTVEDRLLIKALHIEKGWNVSRMIAEFPARQWKHCTLFDLVSKIDSTGSCFSGAPSHRSQLRIGWRKRFRLHWVDKHGHQTRLTWTPWTIQSRAPFGSSSVYTVKKSMMLITWNKSWSAAGTQLARKWLMWLLTSGRNDCCWSFVRKVDIFNIACVDSAVHWTFWLIV